ATAAGPYALQIRGVSHRFGQVRALDDVSLAVPRGAFVVLLGPNGAGKSTLFALATRLYDNTSGEIKILGHDVRRRPMAALQNLGCRFPTPHPHNCPDPKTKPLQPRGAPGHGGKGARRAGDARAPKGGAGGPRGGKGAGVVGRPAPPR